MLKNNAKLDHFSGNFQKKIFVYNFQKLKRSRRMSFNFSELYKKLQESATKLSVKKSDELPIEQEKQDENPQDQMSTNSELSINSDVSLIAQKYDIFKHFLMKDGRIINASDVNFVFVDSKYPIEPIEYINQAKFNEEIHHNLSRKGYRSVFPVQAYAWNLLCKGLSATIVSQKCSGKTLSYLPCLISLLANIDLDEERSVGPFGLIFASSSQEADVIYKLCREFVNLGKFSVVLASGKWNLHEQQRKLLNGCHLLITTPPCFLRLVNEIEDVQVFDRDKLKNLVFDNFDEICEKYSESLRDVLKICTYPPEYKHKNPQIIIATTKWQEMVAGMQTLSSYPTVIISDHIEAAIYAKSRFIITRITFDEKCKQFLSRLETGEFRKIRTVVFVSYPSELEAVKELCKYSDIEFVALSSTTKTAIDELWKKADGSMKVVLATDDAMINYKIKNAQTLIHFSLPKSWTIFTKRFACCFNYYKLCIESKFENPTPTAIVMMDQDNILEVPRMISFLRDHRLVKGPHQMAKEVLKFVEVNFFKNFSKFIFKI